MAEYLRSVSRNVWRNSIVMDTLSEEEQLARIYAHASSTKTSTNSHTNPATTNAPKAIAINHNYKQLTIYIIIKSFVWLFVGFTIFGLSRGRQHQLASPVSEAQQYCCECYQYALQQQQVEPKSARRRIDWFYCAQCISCETCQANEWQTDSADIDCRKQVLYHGEGEECATTDNVDYICDNMLMKTFFKDFNAYGIGALIICVLYVIIPLLALCLDRSVNYVNSVAMLLLIYNMIISMSCFYLIFKAFQYQRVYINDGDIHGPYCYEDTAGIPVDNSMAIFVNILFALLSLQWIFFCCKCCVGKRRNSKYSACTSIAERVYIVTLAVWGIGFFVMTIICVVHIWVYIQNDRRYDVDYLPYERIYWLLIVDAILVISCFDIFCLPFCRLRLKHFCKLRYESWISNSQQLYQMDTERNLKELLLDVDNEQDL